MTDTGLLANCWTKMLLLCVFTPPSRSCFGSVSVFLRDDGKNCCPDFHETWRKAAVWGVHPDISPIELLRFQILLIRRRVEVSAPRAPL